LLSQIHNLRRYAAFKPPQNNTGGSEGKGTGTDAAVNCVVGGAVYKLHAVDPQRLKAPGDSSNP
jgi:hypothetical protein